MLPTLSLSEARGKRIKIRLKPPWTGIFREKWIRKIRDKSFAKVESPHLGAGLLTAKQFNVNSPESNSGLQMGRNHQPWKGWILFFVVQPSQSWCECGRLLGLCKKFFVPNFVLRPLLQFRVIVFFKILSHTAIHRAKFWNKILFYKKRRRCSMT